MSAKIIPTESLINKMESSFERIMELIPVKQRENLFLRRLIAIRLSLDGERHTRNYIIQKLQHASECNYTDSLFDFMKDDHEETACLLKHYNGKDAS